MQNAQSIAPSFPPVASPKIDGTERQGTLPVGPTGRVHRGGGVPWHKRLALTKAPSPAAHHVLLVLGSFVSSSAEEAWPSKATLASMSGRSPRVVQRCLSELKAAGLISVRLSNGGSSHYRLTTATLDARVPPPLDARVSPPQTPASPKGTREVTSTREAAAACTQERTPGKAETKQPVTEGLPVDRHTCPKCGHTWPAIYGTKCFTCPSSALPGGRLQREYADRFASARAGNNLPPQTKTPKETKALDPSSGNNLPPGGYAPPTAKTPNKTGGQKARTGANAPPAPMTPEVREDLEADLIEKGWRKRPDGSWVKAWL